MPKNSLILLILCLCLLAAMLIYAGYSLDTTPIDPDHYYCELLDSMTRTEPDLIPYVQKYLEDDKIGHKEFGELQGIYERLKAENFKKRIKQKHLFDKKN